MFASICIHVLHTHAGCYCKLMPVDPKTHHGHTHYRTECFGRKGCFCPIPEQYKARGFDAINYSNCEKSYTLTTIKWNGYKAKTRMLHPAICKKCEDWDRCNAKDEIGEVDDEK